MPLNGEWGVGAGRLVGGTYPIVLMQEAGNGVSDLYTFKE